MGQYNILEAKTRLSELINLAHAGEDVVIAKAGRPVARLIAVDSPAKRPLGFIKGHLPDEFFEAMGEEDLAEWEGPLISSTPTRSSGA